MTTKPITCAAIGEWLRAKCAALSEGQKDLATSPSYQLGVLEGTLMILLNDDRRRREIADEIRRWNSE